MKFFRDIKELVSFLAHSSFVASPLEMEFTHTLPINEGYALPHAILRPETLLSHEHWTCPDREERKMKSLGY